MNKALRFLVLLAISIHAAVPAGEAAACGDWVPGEVVVRFSEEAGSDAVASLLGLAPAVEKARFKHLNAFVFRLEGDADFYGALEAYSRHPDVEYAEPNYIARVHAEPDDPYFGLQWYLRQTEVTAVWEEERGSVDVVVGIIDTGIQHGHPDLAGRIVPGYNFVARNDNPEDDNGHGTFIAGIIGAATDNGIDMAGINWYCGLMPVKVLDSMGLGAYATVASGIIFAADNGASVINLSLGGANSSRLLEDAVNYARRRGSVLVASTGNDNRGAVYYPAAFPAVIAVGASNEDDARCGPSDWGPGKGSHYGPEIDIVAPGNDIISLHLRGGVSYASGTSASAAVVSGVASLLISAYPGISVPRVTRALIDSAESPEPGWNIFTGHGRLNAREAMNLARIEPVPMPGRWPVFKQPGEFSRWFRSPALH